MFGESLMSQVKSIPKKFEIPLLDLKAQQRTVGKAVQKAIAGVLKHQRFILGPEVAEFEIAMARRLKVRHTVGCASGSDALLLSLMALEFCPGDEVITTPYTFFSTVSSITRLGLRPVFVDVCPDTFQMRVDDLEQKLTKRTRAILPVHLFGLCTEMDPLLDVARKNNLAVIEDAAQAILAEDRGRQAGTMGQLGCLSFFPTKNLGCDGDGGMMVTNDDTLAEKLRILRTHGSYPEYFHRWVGINSRLDTVQAAILLAKLPRLDAWTKARIRNAQNYRKLFKAARLQRQVCLPQEPSGRKHVYNQFVICAERRDELKQFLTEKRIGCKIYYPLPLHLQECFRFLGYQKGDFPVAEKLAATSLALPIYPELTLMQQKRVVETIAEFYSRDE